MNTLEGLSTECTIALVRRVARRAAALRRGDGALGTRIEVLQDMSARDAMVDAEWVETYVNWGIAYRDYMVRRADLCCREAYLAFRARDIKDGDHPDETAEDFARACESDLNLAKSLDANSQNSRSWFDAERLEAAMSALGEDLWPETRGSSTSPA